MTDTVNMHDNPFGLSCVNLAGISRGDTIAQIKYTPDELSKTVEEFIKGRVGVDVKVFVDLEDVIEYELYFIRLEDLDEQVTELVETYFGTGVDLYHELTRAIIEKIFKGYVTDDYVEARMGQIDSQSLITFEFSYDGYRLLLNKYSEDRVIASIHND